MNRAQHYVPQLHLKWFIDPRLAASGKYHLWVYEKGKHPRHAATREVAHRRDFYSFIHEGDRNNMVDEYFQTLESARTEALLRQFSTGEKISPSDKELLSKFIGTLSARVPVVRVLANDVAGEEVTERLQKHIEDPDEFRKTYESLHLRMKGQVDWRQVFEMLKGGARFQQADPFINLRMMLDLAQKNYEQLVLMDWIVWQSDCEDKFVTSDNPVASILPEGGGVARLGRSFANPNIQVICPLTPNSCLFAKRRATNRKQRVTAQRVRQVNKVVMAMADRWLFASENSRRIASLFDRIGSTGAFGDDFYEPDPDILHTQRPK